MRLHILTSALVLTLASACATPAAPSAPRTFEQRAMSSAAERRAYMDLAKKGVAVFELRSDALERAAKKESGPAADVALQTAARLRKDAAEVKQMLRVVKREEGASWASWHDQVEAKLASMEQDYGRAVEKLDPAVATNEMPVVRARAAERFDVPPGEASVEDALTEADRAYPYDAAVRLHGLRGWVEDLEAQAAGLTGDEKARLTVATNALRDQVGTTSARISQISRVGSRKDWQHLHGQIEADLDELYRGWVNAAALVPEQHAMQ
jgi:hypothetical protein